MIISIYATSSMLDSIKYNESLHVALTRWFGLATIGLHANLISFPHITFKVDLFDLILHTTIHVEGYHQLSTKHVPFRFANRVA